MASQPGIGVKKQHHSVTINSNDLVTEHITIDFPDKITEETNSSIDKSLTKRNIAQKLKVQTANMCDLPQRPQSDISVDSVRPVTRTVDWTGCCGNFKQDFLEQNFQGRCLFTHSILYHF